MGRTQLIAPILICLVYGTTALPRVDPLVQTKVGAIKGLAASDGDYSMFLGIPYATVDPLNPFGPSIPHAGFQNTFNAVDDSAVCPQIEEFNNTLVGTLDCLNLNVYVPNTASSANRRPVLVWIYGGGFSKGFAGRYKHGPKFLVRHDVVVVTLNYRLGAYGFMCLDDPRVPGNQGFKDQLSALRWIKRNIGAFGGDSNKITIAGQSAGGVSVDLHLTFSTENLFNNAIIQSGTSFAPFIVHDVDTTGPFKLAEHFGFVTDNLSDALDFLRTVDPLLIVGATSTAGLQTRPCLEREFENVERFITAQPTSIDVPKVKSVPVLIGYVNNERGASFENMNLDMLRFLNLFKTMLGLFNFEPEHLAEMEAIVRQFYIGDQEASGDVKEEILEFVSDFGYYHPSYRRINEYIKNGASTLYHYVFSYDGDRNFEKRKSGVPKGAVSGAVHEDELGYLFDMAMLNETPTPADQLTIDRITTLWTNFVKYSNPTPEVTELLPVQWPAVTSRALNYLDIDSDVVVKKRPFHHRMAFWDMFLKLNNVF